MSIDQPYNEKELLLHVAEGDQFAFTTLFNNYYKLLASYVLRFTESAPVSEEIVQDVFLKIWMTRESLTAIDNFKAYLIVVAKNHTFNALKKLAREKAKEKAFQQLPVIENQEAEDFRHNIIDRAIDQLPPQRKKVYLLARYHRLSYEEIGRHLNLSAKTVKKHMQLAIASITAFVKANASLLLFLILLLKIFF